MKPGIITVNYFSRVENHGRYINIYAAKHVLQPFLLKKSFNTVHLYIFYIISKIFQDYIIVAE